MNPMSNAFLKAVVAAALAGSISISAAADTTPHMQPVDWYTNAVTANDARNRESADRDYYNRQYYNQQYSNREYENQRYNQQYYNRQYYNRQYYNRQYYSRHR
ncbi:hypothetical protein LJR230_001580 [Trinickia sp. LjRoot230]|uniref:hypothetical protein n=1 Tax=Trinickia sp. LjRoot230 TaxID=3342288 RepID=UPI003ED05CA7